MYGALLLALACGPAADTGLTDPDALWHDVDAYAVFRGDQAGELSGWSVDGVGDVSGDGVPDLVIGASLADEHDRLAHGDADDIPPGAAYVFHGPVDPGEHLLGEADAFLVGLDAYDTVARSVAGVGDVDGDGIGEVLVGAMHVDGEDDDEDMGCAYLVRGPVSGSIDLANADVALYGRDKYAHLGAMVAAAGDMNGDGLADLLLGSHLAGGTAYSGEVYVVHGPVDVPTGSRISDVADGMVFADGANALGKALAGAGDVDGDGLDDVVVAAPLDEVNGPYAGAVYVIAGPMPLDVVVSDGAIAALRGRAGDSAGTWVAGAGDTNADGYADVLVGAHKDPSGGVDAGAAHLLTGPLTTSGDLADLAVTITGAAPNDKLGFMLDAAGDVDGDGAGDLVFGAPQSSLGATFGGAAYLVPGPVEGSGSVVELAMRALAGTEEMAMFGFVAGGGDLTGDGVPDVLSAAPFAGDISGAVYLFSGSTL